ncbi:glycosyl transferase [Novosphingobium sp. PC22D]|nr:glycosyl transferase [Novosphingobium sp. PC22D]
MKLIIQIPCYNEAQSLPETLAALPRAIVGIDLIEWLVIDDGSSDGTSKVARRLGVHHIVRHRRNRGLAAAFRSGLHAALEAGADIIVNTDADNQYHAGDIAALVQPVLDGRADVVVGDRGVERNAHFGWTKRQLQVLGSATVRWLSRVEIQDAVSGFRAVSREAARRLTVTSEFSYTTEMLIQAGRKRMAVTSVPVRTNGPIRPSRLFNSIPHFILSTSTTMLRAYAMYNPLKVFALIGAGLALLGLLPLVRFLFFFAIGDGGGHVQSIVLGAGLLTLGTVAAMFGLLADLIGANRKLLEQTLERLHALEQRDRSE